MDEKNVKILKCSGEAKKIIEKVDASKLLNLDNKNCSRMELFLFALACGLESGIETELTKTDTLVRAEYLNTKNEAFLYSLFISDLDPNTELEEIEDIGKVYEKAQRYANTGFKIIDDMLEQPEETVRLEILEELDHMYESMQE